MRWLLDRLPNRDIGDGGEDVFFRRYTLLKTPWLTAYLHEFFRSDHSRCLHDHPWGFVSLILRGGYFEKRFAGPADQRIVEQWHRPGSLLRRRASFAHRIRIRPGTQPWSLVVVGRRTRKWGFWTRQGWRPWQEGEPSPLCETTGP